MPGYSRRDVQKLLGLSDGELRGLLSAKLVAPAHEPGRTLHFSFQDLVVLRTAKELKAAKVPMRRIKRALRALLDQLPQGSALSKVHISAVGDELVVRDEGALYAPASGQLLLDFDVGELRDKVQPLAKRAFDEAKRAAALDAAGWYAFGCDLDEVSPAQARAAYERALSLDPSHLDARINLGRLFHQAGDLEVAAAHYRAALERAPSHAVALFNLGVVLEDLNRPQDAAGAYQAAVAADPMQADAHHNLGHLLERLGQPAAALRHLATYRRLLR